ncbi:MAG: hypothetical protein ACOC8K_09065, partial [Gemmatimonadota bacterium]
LDETEDAEGAGPYGGGSAAMAEGSSIYGLMEENTGPLLEVPDPWPMLPGLITRRVDSESGLLASPWCPDSLAYTEIYVPGTEPTEVCDRQNPGEFDGSRPPPSLDLR